MGEEPAATHEPLVKTVEVPLPVEEAFDLFTTGIGAWWPLRTHSVAEEHAETCIFEPGVGGRILEIVDDGTRHEWGRVLRWEPPNHILFTWYPGRDDESAQEVEVTFTAAAGGTRVELVHTGWEALGDRAGEIRNNYTIGWDLVLGSFVDSVSG